MKTTLIIANIIAAIMLVLTGEFAIAAHHTHAFSVYQELKSQHVLVERPDYDIEKRLATIADSGNYYLALSRLSAAVCLANAVTIRIFWGKQNSKN